MKTAYLFKALGNGEGIVDAPVSLLAHAARKRRAEQQAGPAHTLARLTLMSGVLLKA